MKKKTNSIILVGMPGAGKSTVGVVLAKKKGFRFVDSDLVIQERTGKLLHELIEEQGREGFLQTEGQVNETIEEENAVIATGGSAVYHSGAVQHFRELGQVVYLQLPYQEIENRLGNLEERGVVLKDGQSLLDLYQERSPLYEAAADLVISCEGKTLREIVLEIAEKTK